MRLRKMKITHGVLKYFENSGVATTPTLGEVFLALVLDSLA